MRRRRRGVRYKGVGVGDDLAALTGFLFVLFVVLGLAEWLVSVCLDVWGRLVGGR